MSSIRKWRSGVCKLLIFFIFIMSFLPYIPKTLNLLAAEHAVDYNHNTAFHYDGTQWEPGQWYGYYTVGGYLFSENKETTVKEWDDAHIPSGLPMALTNFKVPDVGVRLNTVAFCLKPIAPNWPTTICAYEITPELCNEFSDVSEQKITERDIDALYIATKELGLTKDAVNVSNEVYTAMRFVCWYIGKCGWQSKNQFMKGIDRVKELLDNKQVNRTKFVSLCEKVATKIESNIGDFETGQTAYMPAFAGRYSSQAPVIDFTDAGNGTYEFTYNYQRESDRYWEYKCPAGVTAQYTNTSVTFVSTVPEPSGMFEGLLKAGSSMPGIVAASGILICKSDDEEAQDMLIPYSGSAPDLTCYFTAQAGSGGGGSDGGEEFPTLPDVEFYRYNETFEANYNIESEKYDSETNQKLANAEFEVLEQSPADQPSILDNYWGSKIDTWNDWKRCKRIETDTQGHFMHSDTRTYDYTGTYCGGHDEQKKTIEDYEAFIEQCEEENAEEEGEGEGGDPGGGGEEADKEPKWDTDAMREHLIKLEEGYAGQISACEAFVGDPLNHFFHSESGSGNQQSDMSNDKQEAYDAFVNLEYDYTVREIRAHSGYLLHGRHNDDNPISVIRTPASESGGTGYVIQKDNRDIALPDTFEHAELNVKKNVKPEAGYVMLTDIQSETASPACSDSFDREKPGIEIPTTNPVVSGPDRGPGAEENLQAVGYAIADVEEFEEWSDQEESDYTVSFDATPSNATPSNATPFDASPADATPSGAAQAGNIFFQFDHLLNRTRLGLLRAGGGGEPYTVADWEPEWKNGSADSTDTGSDGKILFTWHIWDHRVEGEVHINKRDLHLKAGEGNAAVYDSYGDSQGDATLEGAVYGLYAAQDIIHPDGKTGKVFFANDLVSLATTDKNGDASFLAITETSAASASVHNNYDGKYTDANNPAVYQNNLAVNGGQWIGRPLILGRYYIKEIGRSEGYELSVTGNFPDVETNYGADGISTVDNGTAAVSAVLAGGGNSGTNGSIIEIQTQNAVEGVELYLYNYPESTTFGIMRTGTSVKPGQTVSGWEDKPVYLTPNGIHVFQNTSGSGRAYYRWNYNNTTGKYERFEADTATPLYKKYQAGDIKKDSHGNPILVKDSNGNIQYTTTPKTKIVSYRTYQPWTVGSVTIPGTVANVRNTANDLLKEAGYYTLIPSSAKAPWFVLEVTGTETEQVEQILTWFKDHPFYNAAHVERVTETDGVKTAVIRYDYLAAGSASAVLYGTDLYVKEIIPEGNGLYYYVSYDSSQYIMEDAGTVTIKKLRQVPENITMDDVIEDHIETICIPEYETYASDEVILDNKGNPVQEMESVPEISENTSVSSTKTIDYLTDIAEYDPVKKCFKVLIRPERLTDQEKNGVLKIETVHTGMTSSAVHGQTLQVGDYLKYVLGVSSSASVPSEDWTGTYIKDVMFAYDGQFADVYEDAETRRIPAEMEERVIRQKIKVTKDILVNEDGAYDDNTYNQHEDWFTRLFGGLKTNGTTAKKMQNFRFKVYLKSNLEHLYRDEDGQILWQNRKGEEIVPDDKGTISDFTAPYPERVQKIFTKVSHKTDPLYQDSGEAVISNELLYSYTDGLILEEPAPGYTSLLETTEQLVEDGTGPRTIRVYNYDKFFDAMAVANHDKWDDQSPSYTSWQPIGNEAGRTDASIENARVSDMVRQFAIDWYLKDEIKKLVKHINKSETEKADGNAAYTDELYDQALQSAIAKTENYLRPFFNYDLDEIYSIEWDDSENGGSDKDKTTLAANLLYGDIGADSDGYYYGISGYLPYGTYVVVEQQPRYEDLKDFQNRHYQTDKPKEVELPAAYAGYEESQKTPEIMNNFYNYRPAMTPGEMLTRYHIRFQEESQVVQAHGHHGDFQIYKYGLDIDKIKNGDGMAGAGDYFALTQGEFKPYKNYYNAQDDRTGGEIPYYLSEGQTGRNEVSKYYRYSSVSENRGLADAVPYPGGPVTEENAAGIQYRDHVVTMKGVQTAYEGKYASMLVPWSIVAPVDTMEEETAGQLKPDGESAYKGFAYSKLHNRFYSSKLRIEKLDSETHENILHDDAVFNIYAAEREDSPDGTGRVKFYETDTTIIGSREFLTAMGASNITPFMRNTGDPATVSSTADLAFVSNIAAPTAVSNTADSAVRNYVSDTNQVRAVLRTFPVGAGTLYSGIVPAGTPVCKESEQILLKDRKGRKTGDFRSFTTTRDGPVKVQDSNIGLYDADQNTGYLETPQPLGAGVYVLCEIKPPSGYVRTKPVAIEIYSDVVTYYKEGNRDARVAAAIYGYPSDHQSANGNKPEDITPMARINIENIPIKLTVEKEKESSETTANTTGDKTVTYKVSGRIDGSLTSIGGSPFYEYAYENGDYLGYVWKKGTLEYLKARQAAGEQVDIVYNGRMFAGYGYVTRKLETADDSNPYVAGATMTLFEAIELKPSGDREDYAYEGLIVERSATGNINRMYIKQGYAGNRVEFIQENENAGKISAPSCWTAKTVEREDTDILFYDLDSLDIFAEETITGGKILYGYNRDGSKIPIHQLEEDKRIYEKTDTEPSIFAFKGGIPYLEFVGGDFTGIVYSVKDKSLTVGPGTVIYHIDRDGNRDAQVDPHTGMAFIRQSGENDAANGTEDSGKILVWPVNIARDEYGNIIARDKISTSRIATIGENQKEDTEHTVIEPVNNSGIGIPEEEWPSYTHTESGYISGTWGSEGGEESHRESSLTQNQSGQNRNNEILMNGNNGSFSKDMNPVYNEYGLAEYYQNSEETYDKGTDLYDRNDDQVRYHDSDHLEDYNKAAYTIEMDDGLHKKEKNLYHRAGESYILENTWVTSEKTPNDPFQSQITDGQPDILKRIPAGTYIMEELKAPDGYLKAMPTGIVVEESPSTQLVRTIDKTTKIELSKVDSADTDSYKILDMEHRDHQNKPMVTGKAREEKGHYSHDPLAGATLALYDADKIYTTDLSTYPRGWYLKKKTPDAPPCSYQSTSATSSSPQMITAQWTTGTVPIYLEGVPEGYYLLEELSAPSGFVKSQPLEVYITNTAEVQLFSMPNDHTKLEVEKYIWENGVKTHQNGAEFTLYKARTDENGTVIYENGSPQYYEDQVIDRWFSDDATDFTETLEIADNAPAGQPTGLTGFITEFETMYRQYGTAPGTSVRWSVRRQAVKASTSDGIWYMEDGRRIIEEQGRLLFPDGVSDEEKQKIEESWHRWKSSTWPAGETITWFLNRSARYVTHTQIDSTISSQGGQASYFPTSAVMIYETDDNRKVRITIYQEEVTRQGRDFTFEYQFDYRRLDDINAHACSYLTADGIRRFDYLPVGANYVLVETGVPTGYEKAGDRLISIESIRDIQRYSIENRTGELLVSKAWKYNGQMKKELQGAILALYRAAADGTFVQDASHLVERWQTGMDGVYGELDFINGRIPEGYQKGDLKPHRITKLEEGIYYLAELESPSYYTRSAPLRVEYKRTRKPELVRVINQPVTGHLEIMKQSSSGLPLTGVLLEVGAYRKGEREAVWSTTVSDLEGVIRLDDLPVGEPDEYGQISPYIYRVTELVPPEGYAVTTEVFTFQFQPDNHGESYAYSSKAYISFTIRDETTKLYIGKKDFDSVRRSTIDTSGLPGSPFIEGALLAVYEVHGRDSNGSWIYDKENDKREIWRTLGAEERHLIEGLIAGRTYLLKELEAPPGYQLAEPLLFTVSQDGRRIQDMTNQWNLIEINGTAASGMLLTVKGRYATRVEMSLSDEHGRELERWLADGRGHILNISEAFKEGRPYLLTEHTIYSDGSDLITSRVLRRFQFDERGRCQVADRTVSQVVMSLCAGDDMPILSFTPKEYFTEGTTDWNPVQADTEYDLLETTVYSDGRTVNSSQWSFTINEQNEINGMTLYDRKTAPLIQKIDATDDQPLSNARLQLEDDQGTVLETWITSRHPYEIKVQLSPETTYCIREMEAPPGYLQMNGDEAISFCLADILEVTIVTGLSAWNSAPLYILVDNQPQPPVPPDEPEIPDPPVPPFIPDDPDTPSPPPAEELIPPFPFPIPADDPPQKTGLILAFYEPSSRHPGGLMFRRPGSPLVNGHPRPRTGDDTPWRRYLITFTVSLLGILLILLCRKMSGKQS